MKYRLHIIILLCVVAFACRPDSLEEPSKVNFSNLEKIEDSNLRKAVETYFTAENHKEWEKTYSYRGDAFQRLVPYELYERKMRLGFQGWNLRHVVVDSVNLLDGGDIEIGLVFQEAFDEKVNDKLYSGRFPQGQIRQQENTIWRFKNKKWILIRAAKRGHAPFSSVIAE